MQVTKYYCDRCLKETNKSFAKIIAEMPKGEKELKEICKDCYTKLVKFLAPKETTSVVEVKKAK